MKKFLLAVCILSMAAYATAAGAVTLSFYDSFPDNQGDNGFFAYAYDFNANSYRELTSPGVGTYTFNTPGQPFDVPFVAKYTPNLSIFLHPSEKDQCAAIYPAEDAVLAWKAPQNNTYHMSGPFDMLGEGSIIGYIRTMSANLVTTTPLGLSDSQSFDFYITLTNGEMIYFGVNANGTDSNDWGLLKGQIQYGLAPLPPAALLFGTGLLGLGVLRSRCKKV